MCNNGKFGTDCRDTCQCENGGQCDISTGQCSCPAGWVGPVCEQRCSAGRYGLNCMDTCDCQNNSPCDHVTGVCECTPGYMGDQCKEGECLCTTVKGPGLLMFFIPPHGHWLITVINTLFSHNLYVKPSRFFAKYKYAKDVIYISTMFLHVIN